MRPSPLDGATVLLTGASSGIGEAMARQLAPRVARILLVARRRERLDALAAELEGQRAAFEVWPCDLADAEATATLIEGVQAAHEIDVLINNAGLGDFGLFEARDPAKTDLMLRVNVVGLTALTHGFLPDMVRRGRGGVLMVSSGFGFNVLPGFSAYAATKHYVTAFTKGLRAEVTGTGVVISQLCPGPVATEFEDVADAPVDQKIPPFMEITAEECASWGLAGFNRGKAVVVPGFVHWVLNYSGLLLPEFALRGVRSLMASRMREQFPTALTTTKPAA